MKYLRWSFLLCLLSISLHLYASDTVNGVTFSCTSVPHANIRGVQGASSLHIQLTNNGSKKMTYRYHVRSTSTKGRLDDRIGQGVPLVGGQTWTADYTMWDKVGPEDEFPNKCQFTEVQVCPTTPPGGLKKPTSTGVAAYYNPFTEGLPEDGCRTSKNLDVVTLAVPQVEVAGCTAGIDGFSNGHWWKDYGTFNRPFVVHGAATTDQAVSKATAEAKADGFDVLSNSGPYGVQCGMPHGAVVGLRKVSEATGRYAPLPFGVWDSSVFITANSKQEAIDKAMQQCAPRDPTDVHDLHVKGGVTACELIDSW